MPGTRALPAAGAIIAITASAFVHAGYPVTDLVGAAKRGDVHAVRHLLESRPDAVEDRDESGYTPLHWAGIREHWRIVAEVMADREAFLAAGGRLPDEATCRGCHRNAANFDLATWWPKIAHGGVQ